MFDISPLQIIIVLAIALLIFGPKRLPDLGRDLGRGIRDFKAGVTGEDDRPFAAAAHTAADEQPTEERLITEAPPPKAVQDELEDVRTATPVGTG